MLSMQHLKWMQVQHSTAQHSTAQHSTAQRASFPFFV
jgi:hypothetical protein